MILISLGVIAAISSGDNNTNIKENSILKITLDNPIVDRSLDNPFNFDILNFESEQKIGLIEILNNIEKAKNDDRIKGIYMNTEFPNADMATIEEIRNKLIEFKKETNKFIIAYCEIYTQKGYYISSVADKIYLNPEGGLQFTGLAYEGMFFKNALEKLEIEPQIIRHGKFKAAVEPYILEKMSDENRKQVNKFLNSIWNNVLNNIANIRKLDQNDLFQIVENMKIQKPEDAINEGLVDGLLYKDQLLDSLKKKLNLDNTQKINFTNNSSYASAKEKSNKKYIKDKIAIIYAYGDIISGKGNDETIGSERISRAIRNARTDKNIKAIVLRVNSPGGSALASETILREMILAKNKIPIVVSMGDVAASGGYYIAAHADSIVANPTTITGSIGVFGVLMNAKKLFNNKLGITIDTVKTNKYADMGSIFRALNENEKVIIQKSVERIYDTFITHVSKGRNMSKEEVDKIGQGRVWTGKDALELGLVDVLGGLEDAIKIAAKMAKLESYRIKSLPEQIDPMEELINNFTGISKAYFLKNELGNSFKYYKNINQIINMDELQMRLPLYYEIN